MGRGNLIRLGLFVITLALAATAPAAAARVVAWQPLAHGHATQADGATPIAILAPSKTAAHGLVVRVSAEAARSVLRLDYKRRVALGVFGPFGCRDGRVRIARIERAATLLRVRLTMVPLAAGKVECQAIYSTFRLVAIDRSALGAGLPTRVAVSVAGA